MMLYSKIIGEGQPFLILHGFLGMSDNWKTLGTKFSNLGFQVHLIDLRNHGRSFHSNNFSYEIMAQDIADYCTEKKLQSIVLLGHSMGGKVAMETACKFPNLVQKLIIADIGTKYYPPHHQTILSGLNAVDFSKQPTRKEIDDIIANYVPEINTRQFLLKNLYRKERNQLAFRFNLEVLNAKISEIGKALPENYTFKKETLFLRGDRSNYILDTDFYTIKKHFPLAEILTISNAGHWLHAENPDDFFKKTAFFLY